jgi:hypothetical protein
LALIDIPAHVLTSQDELLFELVLKNLYILTTNIAGLLIEKKATVEDLHNQHPNLMLSSKVGRDKLNDLANSSVRFSLAGADLPMHLWVKSAGG